MRHGHYVDCICTGINRALKLLLSSLLLDLLISNLNSWLVCTFVRDTLAPVG